MIDILAAYRFQPMASSLSVHEVAASVEASFIRRLESFTRSQVAFASCRRAMQQGAWFARLFPALCHRRQAAANFFQRRAAILREASIRRLLLLGQAGEAARAKPSGKRSRPASRPGAVPTSRLQARIERKRRSELPSAPSKRCFVGVSTWRVAVGELGALSLRSWPGAFGAPAFDAALLVPKHAADEEHGRGDADEASGFVPGSIGKGEESSVARGARVLPRWWRSRFGRPRCRAGGRRRA